MNEEYQIKIEEKQFLYYKVFKEQYKNCKKFRRRKRLYFLLTCLLYFLFILALYMDIGILILGLPEIFVAIIIFGCITGIFLPRLVNWADIRVLYQNYWDLRKVLYEDGIYTEKLVFYPEGVQVIEYYKKEEISKFIAYKDLINISFYKTGIILHTSEDEDYIYIAKELIIPGLFEPPVRSLRFFRNYPFFSCLI